MKLLHHIKTERSHCLSELPFRIYFYMPIESLMIVSFYPAPITAAGFSANTFRGIKHTSANPFPAGHSRTI